MPESSDTHTTLESADGRLTVEVSNISTHISAAAIVAACQRVTDRYPTLAADHLELGIAWVASGHMAELNTAHRGSEGATDVLSFPDEGPDVDVADGMPRQLGDLVLCDEEIVARHESGTTMVRDDKDVPAAVLRCIVHGLLHLLGEDHELEPDATRMFTLEDEILTELDGASS